MSTEPIQPKKVIFRYMPVRNVEVGKVLLIKGRGEGIVKGILTDHYIYMIGTGDTSPIENIFRVCLQFHDGQSGACLNTRHPTDFIVLPGWGTYMPQDSKELPWRELR